MSDSFTTKDILLTYALDLTQIFVSIGKLENCDSPEIFGI